MWRDCGASVGEFCWECVDIFCGECGEGVDRFGDSADIVCGEYGESVERVWGEFSDSV